MKNDFNAPRSYPYPLQSRYNHKKIRAVLWHWKYKKTNEELLAGLGKIQKNLQRAYDVCYKNYGYKYKIEKPTSFGTLGEIVAHVYYIASCYNCDHRLLWLLELSKQINSGRKFE
jgi:hypothetical protein